MVKKVIILGGEGNGGVVAACIRDMNEKYNIRNYEVFGFLNDFVAEGELINSYPVLGQTSRVDYYLTKKDYYFVYAIHPVGHGSKRVKLFNKLKIPEERLATIIHPSAFIGYNARISPGVMIMANSYIGTAASIGKCTLVMANCVVGHNTEIGSFCHLSAGSVVSSYVIIGEASDIALNATILEKIEIGKYAVAGAGSMVVKEIKDNEIVVGNPAKVLKLAKEEDI